VKSALRTPVRDTFLPLAQPAIGEDEIAAVVATLRSGWLATGPRTAEFEERFAAYVGARHAIGLTSGTAALGLALEVAGIGPGDEVVTTSLTYVATVHEIVHRGATPVLADIDPRTLNLDPRGVEARITPRTKAILLVHFAGRPCAMDAFVDLARRRGLVLLSDAAHAIEARYDERPLASFSSFSAYSFHPVKNLTTGEGGMIATDDPQAVDTLRQLRLHGVTTDAWRRGQDPGAPAWDVVRLGYKCNMSDLQASLGLAQLAHLEDRLSRRAELWAAYDTGLAGLPGIVTPPPEPAANRHARHMYTVLVDPAAGIDRQALSSALARENIGTGHHYPAVHRTRLYRERLRLDDRDLPHASAVSDRIVTLPLHPRMTRRDVADVIEAVRRIVEDHA
jgi:dTDP-4-amino-4,6-dideoxygalactose transaminase